MKESDRSRIEQRLKQERQRTNSLLERADEAARIGTEDDGELTQYDQHPADEGTDTEEQEKSLMLLGMESELLTKIDDALRRLYREPDTFGQCENCGREIGMERLDLLPWTRHCAECATDSGGAGSDRGAAAD